MQALHVLEVREQLENNAGRDVDVNSEELDEGEKALLREMCNVSVVIMKNSPQTRGTVHKNLMYIRQICYKIVFSENDQGPFPEYPARTPCNKFHALSSSHLFKKKKKKKKVTLGK